uniref:Uncharacterized protein n=1 Tax=Oryza nivara TaxID=4536 RepID=A0A679BDW0_ORYNI|nr:hypothetical protein [Oryza sativa f. spontanea]
MLVIMRIPCLAFPSSLPPYALDYDIPLTKGTKIDNLPLTVSYWLSWSPVLGISELINVEACRVPLWVSSNNPYLDL